MTFGEALELMKAGSKVSRSGWNGNGMFICLVKVYQVLDAKHPSHPYKVDPWIGIKTANNTFVPWLASQTDLLAEDWKAVL